MQPLLGRTEVSGLLTAYDRRNRENATVVAFGIKTLPYASLSNAAVTPILEGLI